MPYFVWGSGPPLVFIHGVADSSRSFLLPISRLAARFRCIAYDLPNGWNDGARLGRYSHDDLVDDFKTLLDHLHLDRTYLLASSFGGTVALKALRAFPERLPRAILQGSFAHRPLRPGERFLARLGRWLPGSMGLLPYREKVLRKVNGGPFARQPEAVWRAFISWTAQARVKALAHQALWLQDLDLRAELSEIRQPVLLVVGDRDPVVPWTASDEVLQGLPAGGRVVIEGCGHLPYYTHPELLAEVVRMFLTPPGAGCSTPCPEHPAGVPGGACSGTGCESSHGRGGCSVPVNPCPSASGEPA
jgi:pimeloyl-ACP methyl ester carboxylesterase